MDLRRLSLYLALGIVLVMLWTAWRHDHPAPAPATGAAPAASNGSATVGTAPAAGQPSARPAAAPPVSLQAPAGPHVTVSTDTLDVAIALHGGSISRATLLHYPEHEGSTAKVDLLSAGGGKSPFLVAEPTISGEGIPATPTYSAPSSAYILRPGQKTLRVPLTWHGNGLTVTRTLVFTRGSYRVKMETRIDNTGSAAASIAPGFRLVGADPLSAKHFWDHFLPKYWAYRGPAYYDGSYEKKRAESLAGSPLDKTISGGWIASVKQYFVAAAIPPKPRHAHYTARAVNGNGYVIGYREAPLQVAAGGRASTSTSLFLGPKKQDLLNGVAPGLSRTVDYGKATIISVPLFWLLSHIHGLVGNWGWSIFLLVLLIKAVFYWPQRVSARSMAKMRQLQPRLKLLQERYKDDRQKLSQATMELYRKEGANPVSGCLPMLIQIPIWIGLFEMLIHSVELRQAPWVLWITNLTAPDPYFVLPAIYAVLTLVQFRLQPQTATGPQAKMMMVMPLMFSVFYAIMPSGLVLYYLLNTFLTIAIQYQVNRELGMKGLGILPKSFGSFKRDR